MHALIWIKKNKDWIKLASSGNAVSEIKAAGIFSLIHKPFLSTLFVRSLSNKKGDLRLAEEAQSARPVRR